MPSDASRIQKQVAKQPPELSEKESQQHQGPQTPWFFPGNLLKLMVRSDLGSSDSGSSAPTTALMIASKEAPVTMKREMASEESPVTKKRVRSRFKGVMVPPAWPPCPPTPPGDPPVITFEKLDGQQFQIPLPNSQCCCLLHLQYRELPEMPEDMKSKIPDEFQLYQAEVLQPGATTPEDPETDLRTLLHTVPKFQIVFTNRKLPQGWDV